MNEDYLIQYDIKAITIFAEPTSSARYAVEDCIRKNIIQPSDYTQAIFDKNSKVAPLIIVAEKENIPFNRILVKAGYIGHCYYSVDINQWEWKDPFEYCAPHTIKILELLQFPLDETTREVLKSRMISNQSDGGYYLVLSKSDGLHMP